MTANHHSALYHAPWTPEEDERLARLWPDPSVSKDDLLRLMGRTMRAMSGRARTNNLGKRGSVPNGQGFWTEERLAHLRRMFDEGLSFSQMAEQIGDGCTRSGCIGKAGRLGWVRPDETWKLNLKRATAKATAASREAFRKRREERAHAPAKVPKPRLSVISNRQVFAQPDDPRPPRAFVPRFVDEPGTATILTIGERMCRWPIGDPQSDDFTLCGAHAPEGRVYCCAHHRRAIDPNQPKDNTPAKLVRSLRRYA